VLAPRASEDEFPFSSPHYWGVGSAIATQKLNGSSAVERVVALTVTKADNGHAIFTPTFGELLVSAQERLFQSVKKMTNGTFGGRSAVAQPVVQTYIPRGLIGPGAESAPAWQQLANLPSGINFTELYGGCYDGVRGDRLWYVAPYAPTGFSHLLDYEISTDTWTDHGAIPYTVDGRGNGVYAYDGVITVVGWNRGSTGETRKYTADTASWSAALTAHPHNAYDWCPTNIADAAHPYLYLCGGYLEAGTVFKDYLRRYTVATDTWVELTNPPHSEVQQPLIDYNGSLYIIGASTTPSAAPRKYDIGGNSWSTITGMGTTAFDAPVAVAGDKFIVMTTGSTAYEYDPNADTYTTWAPGCPSGTWPETLIATPGGLYLTNGNQLWLYA
jgi:hypothetical protein